MVHPYLVNTVNAVVLIIVGLVVYAIDADNSSFALLPPAFGLLLLACTHHLRKHNRFVFNTVTALTLLFGILAIMHLYYAVVGWGYYNIAVLLVAISCFIAVGFYIGSFVKERKLRNNTIYKDDL